MIRVVTFSDFNSRVEVAGPKCEFITWKLTNSDQSFSVLRINGDIFVPDAFANRILEALFGSS